MHMHIYTSHHIAILDIDLHKEQSKDGLCMVELGKVTHFNEKKLLYACMRAHVKKTAKIILINFPQTITFKRARKLSGSLVGLLAYFIYIFSYICIYTLTVARSVAKTVSRRMLGSRAQRASACKIPVSNILSLKILACIYDD